MGDLSTNFSRSEFACGCGCGLDTVDYMTLLVLEDVRSEMGKPIRITSGCRCEAHNLHVGGSKGSQHLTGRAADFTVAGVSAAEVQAYLKFRYPDLYGIGCYEDFTHVDTRSNAGVRWSN